MKERRDFGRIGLKFFEMGANIMFQFIFGMRRRFLSYSTLAVQTQCVADSAEPGKPEPAVPQKMIVRKDGIEVEMPADISEKLLLTLLRGLKEC